MSQVEVTDTRTMGKVRLSGAYEAISGTQGGMVVGRTRGGLASRNKPRYKYPKVAAVQAGNARMAAANAVWNTLTWQQAEAWNRYAEGLSPKTSFDGTEYTPSGKNAMVGLLSKILQIDPHATLPTPPPTGRFMPPSVEMTIAGGAGHVTFAASGPTPAGYVAELMVQPLLNERRSPTKFYKSQAFVPFAVGSLTYALPLARGWYAAAVRFVEASTGRVGLLMPLGKFQVV